MVYGCGMMEGYGGYGWIIGLLLFFLVTIVVAVIFWLTYKAIILDSAKKGTIEKKATKRRRR